MDVVQLSEPRGLINGILYSTQFEKTLDDEVVHRIARALIEEPILYLTPEQEYERIIAGLRSGEPLTGEIPQPHSEQAVREFLNKVVRRLDELRPWPARAFTFLPAEHWSDVGNARPIARIQIPVLDVQNRLHQVFDRLDDGHDILLLKLRSGIEVALVTPWWMGSDDAVLLQNPSELSPQQALGEFLDATGFGTDEVTSLTR